MHHFHYVGQNLHFESVDLAEVARLYGTPTYVTSAATMADNYNRLANSLTGLDVQLCYAMKANRFGPLLDLMRRECVDIDACSPREVASCAPSATLRA